MAYSSPIMGTESLAASRLVAQKRIQMLAAEHSLERSSKFHFYSHATTKIMHE